MYMCVYIYITLFNYYAILQYFLVFIVKSRCVYMYVCVCVCICICACTRVWYVFMRMSIYAFVWFVCNSICV